VQTILVIEDEVDIAELVAFNLKRNDFEVVMEHDGLSGLATARELLPDLIVLDLMMPGLDGPSALAKIREIDAYKTTPAVFMTAKVQPNEIQQYLDMGAVDVIPKPFDPMTLAEQLQEIWKKSQL